MNSDRTEKRGLLALGKFAIRVNQTDKGLIEMQSIKIENLQAETAAVMNLRWTQGLTVPQALCVAREKRDAVERNYQLWIASPTNQRAVDEARENYIAIDYVVRVLEAASAPAPESKKKPCPHYATIRRFFGIARQRGLNVDDEGGMRQALSAFLNRVIPTREVLTGNEWAEALLALRNNELAW